MKAVVKYAPGRGNIALRHVPEPVPACDQVKIKVMAASICSSDMLYWQREDMSHRIRCPVILGHEGAGVAVEVGERVRHVKPGDRVLAETTLQVCNACDACADGRYNDCKGRKGLGSSADGFFAQYMVALGRSVHVIPDFVSFQEAALMEPVSCVTHAIFEQGNIRPYHEVLVSGPGPIGLFSAQIAKLCGATVIVSGTRRSLPRLRLAVDLGFADHIVNSSQENLKQRVMELTEGRGVDVVLECSGAAVAIAGSLEALKDNGTLLWMGAMHTDEGVMELPLNHLLIDRQLHLIGARSSTPASWGQALRLLRQKKLYTKELVGPSLPLENWEKGFQMVQNREAIKVILAPWS